MTRSEQTQTSIFTATSRCPRFAPRLRARTWVQAAAALTVIFALAVAMPPAQAQTLSVLHTFTGGEDGGEPYAGLTMDQAGNLYGTTYKGGAGYGTVFKLSRAGTGWILTTLYAFQGGADGAYPYARVVFGPDGALYGTTNGYNNSNGTVFSLRPPATACASVQCPWIEAVLYLFPGLTAGGHPGYGDLAFDAAGNIYGTTMDGGGGNCAPYYNCGVVFKLTRSGQNWTESVLYGFGQSDTDGVIPYAGVVLDSAGNLYGTNSIGGIYNGGTLYKLTQSGSSWTETILHAFGGTDNDGSFPAGGLIMDQQGNLYGTTQVGPGNDNGGTVYELQLSGGNFAYSVLAALPYDTEPVDALTMDAAGNLYATGNMGGSKYAIGNVFSLTPSAGSWTYTDLHDFNGDDGAFPYGNVVMDAQGNLYSTTSAYGGGEVWELTP